jgi:lipoprotein-anchoring transpeptidase ErfK/SrfK
LGLIVGRLISAAAIAASALISTAASADVLVQVDLASQTMQVSVDGGDLYSWKISTARPGYRTPTGVFHPQWMAARWFSRIYNNSPMPHSIFFYRGYAIHGTYEIARLGGPASHGCVRLDPGNASVLFGLVERQGMGATSIVVH